MLRTLAARLAPLRRHLSTQAQPPLVPFNEHTPSIPTSIPGRIAPGTSGSLAHIKRHYDEDPRGELIRTAKARRLGVNVSHRKLNMVARLVRRMPVDEAFRQLAVCNKKSAPIVGATLAAAIKNAMAFSFRRDRLVVDEAWVGKGCYISKIRPWHGKGRFGVEHKKYAHLTVVVRELDDELWEELCMPQYLHIPRKPLQSYNNHPIHKSDRCSWVSDLDESLRATKENVVGLRVALQQSQGEESPATTQATTAT